MTADNNKQKTIRKEYRVRKWLRRYFNCSDDQLNVMIMNILSSKHIPTRDDICANIEKIRASH